MAFGLEFQNMTEREILIELYKNQATEHLEVQHLRAETKKELTALQDKVARFSCPSALCAKHEQAIAQNREDLVVLGTQIKTTHNNLNDLWIVGGLIVTGGLGLAGLLLQLWGF